MIPSPIEDLIKHLQAHEMAMASVYEVFSAEFPSHRAAWETLNKEENLHAKWIDKLYGFLKADQISFEQTKFTVQSIKTSIAFIEKQIETAKKEKPDLKKAVAMAVDIEKSLLESAFFKVFNLNEPKAQKIRAQLEEATRAHLNRLLQWQASL